MLTKLVMCPYQGPEVEADINILNGDIWTSLADMITSMGT